VSRPATRLLALLELLQDRGLVTVDELARRLEVDPRSVRRYATALREMGIAVESVRGPFGGYRLTAGHRQPPLMLSDDEAVAIAVVLTTAARPSAAGEPSPTDRALLKLNRLLPPVLRQRVHTLAAATDVIDTRRSSSPGPDPESTLTLAAAVRAGHRVRIEHRRPDARTLVREVDPYGLVVHGRNWYLVGHDHLRGEVRTFRLDRITGVAELAERCAPPSGFDPVAHVRHGLTLGAWRHRTEVWLDTDVETAGRLLPTTAGELHAEPTGGVRLVSGVENLPGMARMLAGMPWRFTVIGPDELVEALAEHVRSLTDALGRSRTHPA
jgi:predicted DNA-binding transcriptional regulator YafY